MPSSGELFVYPRASFPSQAATDKLAWHLEEHSYQISFSVRAFFSFSPYIRDPIPLPTSQPYQELFYRRDVFLCIFILFVVYFFGNRPLPCL